MTVTPIRVPVASVQGTLALDLSPRHAPPEPPEPRASRAVADVVPIDPTHRGRLEQWVHRFVQASVEIVGGDRPASQLLRWTTGPVYADLHRRALLVARAGGHQPGVARVQPVRPARRERARQLRQPQGRRGQRAGALRHPVPGPGAALREAARPMALHGDGVRLAGC